MTLAGWAIALAVFAEFTRAMWGAFTAGRF